MWGFRSKTSSTRAQSIIGGGRCGRKAAHVAGKTAERRTQTAAGGLRAEGRRSSAVCRCPPAALRVLRSAHWSGALCEHTFVSYVELHCHSAFSFLDGASHPIELIAEAARQGHSALALTDHDGLHGAMEFAVAAGTLGV